MNPTLRSLRTARRTVSLVLLFSLVLAGTGCDSGAMDEPTPRALSGTWTGPITHVNPSLNGTLRLTMTQAGDVLTGTAVWRFSNQAISGHLLGTVPDAGPITFTLDFGDDGTYFHETILHRDGTMTGEWVSSRSSGITGTTSLERQ